MIFGRQRFTVTIVAVGLYFFCPTVHAVFFEPGVGVGVEYTDNATLVNENKVDNIITIGYVGARVKEDEGALTYDATALMNNRSYTDDTFPDKRYITLGAGADWEMMKERFNWFIRDSFSQRTVNALNSNTPNNLQDTNIFAFGAKIDVPITARQSIKILPTFNQYYYEKSFTDNNQFILAGNWSYQLSRLNSMGFNLSAREINYTEEDIVGQTIEDTRFTNASVVFKFQRQRSALNLNLGNTKVEREGGQKTSGFSGYLSWWLEVTGRSSMQALVSTKLSDTSRVAISDAGDAADGVSEVQITTDVIRDSNINLSYARKDSQMESRLWARYRKLTYSDNPLDRIVQVLGLQTNRPISPLLVGGAYFKYSRTKQLDTQRLDDQVIVGGELKYKFSRKLNGVFDMKYRKKKSTFAVENYNEFSVFVSLVYGYGSVSRPTRTGGF